MAPTAKGPRLQEAGEALSGPRWLRAAGLVAAALCAVVPLLATVLYSVATVWRRRPLPDGFTLHWWGATVRDPAFLGAVARSATIALLAVILINLLLLPPLTWAHVRNPRILPFLSICALIPFVLPGVVMAMGINRFVGLWPVTARLQATPQLLLLGTVATSFPAYLWAVDAALRTAQVAELWDAADTLGASAPRTLWRIVLPNIRQGITAGSLLVFAAAMGELALARIITGQAFETLPLWQLRTLRGTDASPNAMAVSGLLGLAILFLFTAILIRRSRGAAAPLTPGVNVRRQDGAGPRGGAG
jgi:putative spermidine/putrescine transport system permease protein